MVNPAGSRADLGGNRASLGVDLRRGLEAGEVIAHYQPQVDVITGAVVGAEALARWAHPQRGLLGPGEFIDLAERTGLIEALTGVMLEQAVRECREGEDAGWRWGVSVNVATSSLIEHHLVDQVTELLDRYGLLASRLTLEITESAIMAHPDRTQTVLAALKAAGVRLSIDDFGTGYSSLARLHHLPLDELKVDRSFVADLREGRDPVVLNSIVGLGRRLGYRVVAEGIEEDRDLAALAALGCDVAQGFWLARPLPPAGLADWLKSRSRARSSTVPARRPTARRATPNTVVADPASEAGSLTERLYEATFEMSDNRISLKEACERMLGRLGLEVGARAAVWWMLDQRTHTLECHGLWRAPGGELEGWSRATRAMSIAPGVGVAGRALEIGQPAFVSDLSSHESFLRRDAAERDGLRGLVAFPVMCEEHRLGVIELWETPLIEGGSAHTRALFALGARLGQFVQRRAAECVAENYALALRVLRESLGHLACGGDPVAVRRILCAAVREVSQADVVFLWEPDARGTTIKVTGSAGWTGQTFESKMSDEASGAAAAFNARQPRFVPNVRADAVVSRRLAEHLGAVSAYYHPIQSAERTVAVFAIAWRAHTPSLPVSVPLAIEILAEQATPAL